MIAPLGTYVCLLWQILSPMMMRRRMMMMMMTLMMVMVLAK